MKSLGLVLLVMVSVLCFMDLAIGKDFEVGQAEITATGWGKQSLVVDVTNLAPEYKFIVAECELSFDDPGNPSARYINRSFIIEPGGPFRIEVPIEIPGNFGQGLIYLNLYDVIDTLDQPLASQKFYSRDFQINIPIPQSIQPIVEAGIQIPPLADLNEMIDNQFSRILILLLHQGKTPIQIAKLCGVDDYYVKYYISQLQREGFIKADGNTFKPAFSVLDSAGVAQMMPYINETVDGLYRVISGNLRIYDSTVEAMARQGRITSDHHNLLESGSVLYHHHPVVEGLLLWDLLGRDFVNDGIRYILFKNPNVWRANMGEFMYLVQAPKNAVGRTFYYYPDEDNGERFFCGKIDPGFKFEKDLQARHYLSLNMVFNNSYPPVYYSYEDIIDQVPLSLLMNGVTDYAVKLKKEIDRIFPPADRDNTSMKGARLWCWDMVVTGVMNRLEENNILKPEGSGIYIFQNMGSQ
nr:hypothetical protein [candidate division Zixibacteria bacterium]